jgi:hypothetical protein
VETSARMAAGLPEHNEYVDPGQTGTISSRPRRCSQAAISCACPAGSTRFRLRKKAAASEGAMGRRSSSGDHRAGQGAGRIARRAVMQLRGEVPRLDAHECSVLPSGKIGPRTRVRIRSICRRVRVRCSPSAPRIIAASGGAPGRTGHRSRRSRQNIGEPRRGAAAQRDEQGFGGGPPASHR